jgi:hypothetical protein
MRRADSSRQSFHSQKHRVDRVLSFFSSRWNWDSLNPSPACECDLPNTLQTIKRSDRSTSGLEAMQTDTGLNYMSKADSSRQSFHSQKHRVDRVLSFFSSRRNWDSPPPTPQACLGPPLLWFRGEGHKIACGRGAGGGGPNSNEGTYIVIL